MAGRPGGPRRIRRRLLRHVAPSGRRHRPSAPPRPRTRLGGAGERRHRPPPARRQRHRCLRRHRVRRLRDSRAPCRLGIRRAHRHRPAPRPRTQPSVLFPWPARPQHRGRHGPVVVARGRAPRLREPAPRGEHTRRRRGCAPGHGGREHHRHGEDRRPLAGRAVPHFRRPGQRLRQGRRRCRARPQAAEQGHRGRRPRPLRHKGRRGEQRRRRRQPDHTAPPGPGRAAPRGVHPHRDTPGGRPVRRAARDRHPGGRPGGGSRAGRRPGHGPRGGRGRPARGGIGQDERRTPGGRCRHRRSAQGRAVRTGGNAAAQPQLPHAPPGHPPGAVAPGRADGPGAMDRGTRQAPRRRCVVLRHGRDERACGAGAGSLTGGGAGAETAWRHRARGGVGCFGEGPGGGAGASFRVGRVR